jgi:energy-coupling factor transporter ATP-binding protein EcfA2
VKLASVDQFRDAMDNSKTVWEEVSGGLDIMRIGNTEMPSRAYVGRFNFKGTDQGKRVGELSGGERGRLHLAKLLQVGGNVLLLDEPTNDLDIETLRALENALLESTAHQFVMPRAPRQWPRPLTAFQRPGGHHPRRFLNHYLTRHRLVQPSWNLA